MFIKENIFEVLSVTNLQKKNIPGQKGDRAPWDHP